MFFLTRYTISVSLLAIVFLLISPSNCGKYRQRQYDHQDYSPDDKGDQDTHDAYFYDRPAEKNDIAGDRDDWDGRSWPWNGKKKPSISHKDSPEGKNRRRQKIRYLLRNRTNSSYVELNRNGTDAEQHLVKDGTLKMLIHGWTFQSWETVTRRISRSNLLTLADEYVHSQRKDLNVILVDWTELSTYSALAYHKAADSSRYAGKDVTEFIIKLKNAGLANFDKVHLIGFGLGAQVAGVAGHGIVLKTNGSKIARITGLDPAGHRFVKGTKLVEDKGIALDIMDASFVDIIHCNEGDFQRLKFGSNVQAGHADFYPNGGTNQTECGLGPKRDSWCDHYKCPVYYLRTVNSKRTYPACSCDSWALYKSGKCDCTGNSTVNMGEYVDTSKARGRYYLEI